MPVDKIVLKVLTKVFSTGYGPVTALSSVDLTVREGEFFVLLGPSGCGKTTLVRIMAGLEHQTSGEFTRRFVHEQDFGIRCERTRHADSFLHPS